MVSVIQKEIETNAKEMAILIKNQTFSVADAERFMARHFNFVRMMEDLETSRNLWRDKFKAVEKCNKCELCLEHSKGRKK